MKNLSTTLFAAISVLSAASGVALAQPEGGATETDATTGETTVNTTGKAALDPNAPQEANEMGPAAAVSPSLTLGTGHLVIAGSTLNIDLSKGAVGKPVSLAPSVWYGVNEQLTLGVTHDGGTTQWTPRPATGAGICISGKSNGCPKVYNNVGVDAIFGLSAGKLTAAVHPGLDARSIDPLVMNLRLGLLGRYELGEKLALVFDPRIGIGLNKRKGVSDGMGGTVGGNKEYIDVPAWVWLTVSPKLGLYGSIGLQGQLSGFSDTFAVPLGAGATFAVSEKVAVGGDFYFNNLIGKGHTVDARQLGIRVSFAL